MSQKNNQIEKINKQLKKKEVNLRVFRFHVILFIIINVLLYGINFIFSRSYPWFLFPLFGWLVGLLLHGGVVFSLDINPNKRGLLFHVLLYISVNVLLFVINLITSTQIWWVLYPFAFWGVALLVHGAVYKEFLANKPPKKKEEGSKLKKSIKKLPFIDKANSLRKRVNLLSHSPEKIKEETEVKQIPKINSIKAPSLSTENKKLKVTSESLEAGLSERENIELKRTELEVEVEKKELICVVHKGPITGTIYNCPKCQTFYCLKCAQTLEEKGEKCWSCDGELQL